MRDEFLIIEKRNHFLSRDKSYILKPLKTRQLVCPSVNPLMNVPGFPSILLDTKLVFYFPIAQKLRKILNMYLDKKSVTLVMVSKLFTYLCVKSRMYNIHSPLLTHFLLARQIYFNRIILHMIFFQNILFYTYRGASTQA